MPIVSSTSKNKQTKWVQLITYILIYKSLMHSMVLAQEVYWEIYTKHNFKCIKLNINPISESWFNYLCLFATHQCLIQHSSLVAFPNMDIANLESHSIGAQVENLCIIVLEAFLFWSLVQLSSTRISEYDRWNFQKLEVYFFTELGEITNL